jgi:hypothetical protein
MNTLKFTKEVKENWIRNMESGKYKQGYYSLVSRDSLESEERFCCIGILGDCTPGLDNMADSDNSMSPYKFLSDNFGNEMVSNLYRTNDRSRFLADYAHDYSNVLPLIKSLPTQD